MEPKPNLEISGSPFQLENDPTTGVYRTKHGTCPIGGQNPMACMFCSYGHILECHYPKTCEEVQCSHYDAQELGEDYEDLEEDIEIWEDPEKGWQGQPTTRRDP